MFHSYFQRKDEKFLTFDVIHFSNVEINDLNFEIN